MGIPPKIGKCKACPPNAPDQPLIGGFCNNHYWEDNRRKNAAKNANKPKKPQKPIPKKSKKKTVEDLQYNVLRIEFLGKKENQKCPITGKPTTDIHHKKGRVGYADEWARDNKVSLTLDTRYWVALSREGHKQVENNPEWAKENGYSLSRLAKE